MGRESGPGRGGTAKAWKRAKDSRPREVGGPPRSLARAVFRGHRGECGNRR